MEPANPAGARGGRHLGEAADDWTSRSDLVGIHTWHLNTVYTIHTTNLRARIMVLTSYPLPLIVGTPLPQSPWR